MKYYISTTTGQPVYFHELGEKLYGSFYIFKNNGSYGIQSERYEVIIPPVFQAIKPAFRTHFWGKLYERWRLYNFENHQIGTNCFRRVEPFNMNYAAVTKDGRTWGFIDRQGRIVIPLKYNSGAYLGMDYFAVSIIREGIPVFGVIDSSENIIIPFNLSVQPTFSDTMLFLLKKRKPLREWLNLGR